MDDFIVPPVEDVPAALTPQQASAKAFYAAATSSPDPVNDYQTAKADLEFTGKSSFVDTAAQAWKDEQDAGMRTAVEGIITDPSIPSDQKKVILQTYALTGFVQPDLKQKYIQQTATKQVGFSKADIEAQDAVVSTLEQRNKQQAINSTIQRAADFTSTVLDDQTKSTIRQSLEGGAAALSDILIGIPAGIGKVYSLLKDKDVAKANQLQEKIKAWAYDPTDAGSQQKRDDILNFLAPLGAFNQLIYKQEKEAALKAGASPAKAELDAMASSIVEDPLSWIGIGSLVGKVKERPLLEVPADSPAAVTQMANPQVAEKASAAAVVDKTGKYAEALGADRGTIVHDWVLSKPIPDKEQAMRPDLIQELNRIDTEMRGAFQDYRYDPNLMDATKREEEVSRVWDVIREHRGPYYQQSNSSIIETPGVFEGNAIYGRNASSGYLRESDAIAAKDKLMKSLEQLPEEYRGDVSIIKNGSEYFVQQKWKKEYDELAANVFGPDAVKTSILGIPAGGLARTTLGKWLFPTGWAPDWVERGAARGISRTAVLEKKMVRELQDKIASTPYGKELTHLIDEGEQVGKDYFSPQEIGAKFPYLKKEQVDELFATHTYWRRFQEYQYNFMNRIERERLSAQGMQALFDKNGNFIQPVTKQVAESELDTIKAIWNFDTDNVLEFTPQLRARQDKTIVRLHEPIIMGEERFNYGLVGTKNELGMLPTETLPRIAGFSPRRVKENFYVDVTPKKLTVDGMLIKDELALRNYTVTKAATKTEAEGWKVAAEFQDLYPDHHITVRPERADNFGQIVSDYKVVNEMFRHSMKRGERLPSYSGLARVEDRLHSEISTVKTLSRLEAFRTWDDTFQSQFVKEYGKFLPKKQFPRLKTDIHPLENMDRALKKQYDNAHRLLEFYARQKNFETLGDFLWKKGMHWVADVLEKVKIPGEILREWGKSGNPLMKVKTVITSAYIHLAPARQWVVQPAQMAELIAINPVNGIRNLTLIPQILMDLGADASIMKPVSAGIKYMTSRMAKANEKVGNVSVAEYADILKGIRQSGITQSVDMNSIIHGVFKNADEAFVPSTWDQAWSTIKKYTGLSIANKGIHVARNVGFDAAEITNQIGTWLQTRNNWIDKNPGKKWNTKEAIEQISHESWRLSGNMTRAGNLPYQEGALSLVFQFAAIQQKLLMNLLQDTATNLTAAQRAKLSVLRLGAYGVKYGLPGGALVYYLVDNEADPQVKEVMNQEVVRRGFIDYATNGVIASTVYPDDPPDLAVTKSLSPYSDSFLPMLDVLHAGWLMIDGDPVSKPRIPVLGFASSFGKAMQDMQGWWITRDVNEDTFPMMAQEAAELASGFNSYWQGQLMLGMQDKVSKMGNKMGLESTKAEAYAKMFFGIPTQKEEDLWDIVKNERNAKGQLVDKAKEIHGQLMNMRTKLGTDDYETYARQLNSFISLLDPKYFNEQDKYKIMDEIVRLDRNSFTNSRESVFASYWARYSEQMTQDRQVTLDILKRSNLPKAQETAKKLEEGKL